MLRLRDKVAKVPRHRRPDDLGQARPAGLRGAAQARRGARARPDDDAARGQPAQLRQRRRRHLLDLARRRAGRCRAAPAARRARERRRSSTACRSPTPRTGRRSSCRASPTSCRWSTRSSSSARTCSAARRSTPAREGRPSGDVGADVQKIVKETQLPPGYRFDVGGQTKEQAEAFQGVLHGARRGGDLHLHRPGVAVRQLPAAARDHGLAAAGADRRDAGAARHALDASTCSR